MGARRREPVSAQHDERLARLPKWVAAHLGRLERDLEEARADLRKFQANAPTAVEVQDGLDGGPLYLSEEARVVFRLDRYTDPEARQDARIAVRLTQDGYLEAMAIGYPMGLVVRPQAANVVRIEVAR